MNASDHIGNLVENAIEKRHAMLDVMRILRKNSDIKWDNLGIQNESDFLKGYLLTEVLHDFAINFHKLHGNKPSSEEIVKAHKVFMRRAGDIKKSIADIGI